MAASQKYCSPGDGNVWAKYSFEICAHCQKPGKTLKLCAGCKNIMYCDQACQKSHWAVHKVDCKRLANVRNSAKNSGKYASKECFHPESATTLQAYTAASGHGSVGVILSPKSDSVPHMITFHSEGVQTPEQVSFKVLDDLSPALQFLLCCGPFNDIERAKRVLPSLLKQLPGVGAIAELRVQGAHFTALDWAARKGNREIVEWFCTDQRLSCCLQTGTPIGWACYTNHVDIARLLQCHGVSPAATNSVFFGSKPPLLAVAEAGHLLAMRWLVEEVGHDLRMECPIHGSVMSLLREIGRMGGGASLPGHAECLKWALARAASG